MLGSVLAKNLFRKVQFGNYIPNGACKSQPFWSIEVDARHNRRDIEEVGSYAFVVRAAVDDVVKHIFCDAVVLRIDKVLAYIPEFVEALVSDKVCPIFTTKEVDEICARIKSEKIIPVLGCVPEDFYYHTKRVWWLIPFCIWKEDVASLVFVDKNGFYAMFSKDGEEEINMIFNWDAVDELEFEYEYDGDPNINRLTVTQESGGYLTFDEFVCSSEDGDHGSYLSVIEAIWEARRETIEASKGESMWFEGKGGEGFKEFKKPQDLLKAAKWENPNRPDPSMYGG